MAEARKMVLECLRAVLSGGNAGAEQRLRELENQSGFAFELVQIVATREIELGLRQLAALVLKRVMRRHWDESSDDFDGVLMAEGEKQQIRAALSAPQLVGDADSKIRMAVSMALSTIAEFDISLASQNTATEMLSRVLSYVSSDSLPLVDGALRCIMLLVEDLSPDQLITCAGPIFEVISRIAHSIQNESSGMGVFQMRSIRIFRCLMTGLTHVAPDDSRAAHLVNNNMAPWLDLMAAIMSIPITSVLSKQAENGTAGFGLHAEVVATISALHGLRPRLFKKVINPLLNGMMSFLADAAHLYENGLSCSTDTSRTPFDVTNTYSNEDGTDLLSCLEKMISLLREFVNSSSQQIAALCLSRVRDAFTMVITLLQVSDDDMQRWIDAPGEFWDGEEDESAYSLRVAVTELLQSCVDAKRDKAKFLDFAIQSLTSVLTQEQSALLNWKQREVLLLTASILAGDRADELPEYGPDVLMCLLVFFDRAIAPALKSFGSDGEMLVTCRALLIIPSLITVIDANHHQDICSAVMAQLCSGNDSNNRALVQLAACATIGKLCTREAFANYFLRSDMQRVNSIVSIFCRLLVLAGSSSNAVEIVLQALKSAISSSGQSFSPELLEMTVQCTLTAWQNNVIDPLLSDSIVQVLEDVADMPSEHGRETLRRLCLPAIIQILQTDPIPGVAVETVIQLVNALLSETVTDALSHSLVQQILPLLLRRLSESDDQAILSAGAACLGAFIRRADAFLQPELCQNILSLLEHLLGPQLNDESSQNVATLCLNVLERFPSKLSDAAAAERLSHSLIGALIQRFQRAEKPDFLQEMIVVFSKLVHVLEARFVTIVDAIGHDNKEAEPLFNTLLRKWLISQSDVHSVFATKASISSLIKLITLHHSKLMSLQVVGYEVVDTNAPRRTRSSKAPPPVQIVHVSALTKILSIALDAAGAAQSAKRGEYDALCGMNGAGEDDYDDGSSDESNADSITARELVPAQNFCDWNDDDYADDPSFRNDPLNNIDLAQFVPDFIHWLANQQPSVFQQSIQSLRDTDKQLLSRLCQMRIE